MYPPIANAWFHSQLIVDVGVEVPGVESAMVVEPKCCDHRLVYLDIGGHKYPTRDVLCSIDYGTELHLLPVGWLLAAFGGSIGGVHVNHSNVSSEPDTQITQRAYLKRR